MARAVSSFKSGDQLSKRSIIAWRTVQFALWLAGTTILSCLLFIPATGTLLFWNILIPLAPLIFVVAPGVWRNVCPLGTTVLLPRHLGLTRKKRLTVSQSGKLNLAAVIALFVIVPLRHAVFNNSGHATAALIIGLAITGIIFSYFYEWKSAWCSGLCPVHPVEKLYGGNALMPVPNAHCSQCRNCVVPCPDSAVNINAVADAKTRYQQISALLITGGLPGFIWGWFHVPDENSISSLQTFLAVYKMPMTGFAISLLLYVLLQNNIPELYKRTLHNIFAAAGVSFYYWYRIPSLFGFGQFGKDGLLVNLQPFLPAWSMIAIGACTTAFFIYWLLVRKPNNGSWLVRPAYSKAA